MLLGATLAAGVVAGLAPPAAAAALRSAPPLPHDKSIPVTPVTSHYHPPAAMPAWHATPVSWPTGTATITLPATAATNSAHPTSSTVRAGALPVWLGPASSHPSDVARSATSITSSEQVSVVSRATATAAGVSGVVVSLQRTDTTPTGTAAHLSINYTGFQDAFGGDWASRLHLVQLPACALTSPSKPACRTQIPLASTVDNRTGTVSADVTLAGKPAPAMVIAATSAPAGGGGDFTATSLKPSGSWQAGGSADAFTWSYPISVPPVPGGLEPTVGLSYDSQSVDGLTSSTNNQPSWMGDGWDYSPGYIERSYTSCGQNPVGPTKTGDNCWSPNNTLTLSLGGRTSTLIRDDATGNYHPQDDSNERVQYLGAPNSPGGVQGNEHFIVTTTDGTQYYFGLNQLPGWVSGNPTTNSVWTEPVYASAAGQPCYTPTFAASSCPQAYRWNLDYVVDTHSDVVSYFYATETNAYAPDNGSTATASYIRGGYLTKIQYGQRDRQVYTTQPAGQVLFTTTGRCTQTTCDPATLSAATAGSWPDVPEDLACTSGAACSVTSPGFWSDYVLSGIQTQALYGTTETTVDSWSLTHSFPDTKDNTTPVVWLSSITHTGQDPEAIGNTTATPPAATSPAITLPPVVFTGTPLSNRVRLGIGYAPITRQRLTKITTETGETVTVGYTPPTCTTLPTDPSQNSTLCFPDYWTPPGQDTPILDWFNKFTVAGVTETDPITSNGNTADDIQTTYTPVGNPAWHYNDNPITPTSQRTWDQWRGFPGMIVSTGSSANDPVTKTQYTYFRGMNGDTLPGGATRSVSVTDSRGESVPDANQNVGDTYETLVYNGSAVVTDTIADPWSSTATATHAVSGLPNEQSFRTGTADTRVYTPLAGGTTRETETIDTHDTDGRVTQANDLGDVSTPSDDLCTTNSYADNTTAWIFDAVAETSVVSVACTATPTLPRDAVSDTRTFYDQSTTLSAPPTVGDVTMTQQAASYTGSTPNLITTSTSTVDQYGRTLTNTNGDGKTTSTVYTPSAGAEPTSIAVTDPMHFLTTTTYDPLRDLPQSKTDPAKYVSSQQYDALGRLTVVNSVGVPAATKYTYTVSNTGPSVVDTYAISPDGGSYHVTEILYDALLRARETQTQTPDNERLITDTIYNSDGWVAETTDPYVNASPVAPTYVEAQAGDVPSATGYTYDGAGRKTAAIANALGSETWRTSYTYGGDFTTTVPPVGGTATTTLTDARGNTTDLLQYHTGVPTDPINDPAGDYSDTHYTYTPAGKQATVVDAAANTWSYQYDLLGEQTTAQDPDAGTSTTSYDKAGLITAVTDARGKQTTTTYDNDARKTGQYDTTTTQTLSASNKIAAWTYDTALVGISGTTKAVGYPASTTSINGGDTYTQTVQFYNLLAKPLSVRSTLTGTDTGLLPAAGIVTSYGYSANGIPDSEQDPAIDGLPTENVNIGLDAFGQPISLGSPQGTSYVTAVGYSELGQPLRYTMPASAGTVWIDMTYDQQTQALKDVRTTDSNSSTVVDDTSYTFGGNGISPGSGLLTSTTDNQNAGASIDTQCFGYDYAQRLSSAWSATDNCAAAPSGSTVGGPAPYWQSWTYDAAGDRATQTDHDTAGTTANDTTTTYQYPTADSGTDQPHTLTATTATGPNAAANTASYTYDPAGDTTGITGGATGNQTLTWNDQGHLATDTTTAGASSYVYDSSGNLIVRRDPGQTTMFFGDEQLVRDTSTGVATATRYYSLGDTTIASRTGATGNAVYLIPDRQGTDQLAIDASTYQVTRRQYLPFGQPRGTPSTTWPGGDTGYVGGTPDPTTSLENLGAREYNPANGRFLSIDPVFEAGDPTQMGGYDYAGNNPVTGSDPSGQMSNSCVDGCHDVGDPFATPGGAVAESGTGIVKAASAPVIKTYPGGTTLTIGRTGARINGVLLPAFVESPEAVADGISHMATLDNFDFATSDDLLSSTMHYLTALCESDGGQICNDDSDIALWASAVYDANLATRYGPGMNAAAELGPAALLVQTDTDAASAAEAARGAASLEGASAEVGEAAAATMTDYVNSRYVYRGGSAQPDALTPKPKDTTGLSTFDNPEAAAGPDGGKVQIIDTWKLRLLMTNPDDDPPGHVALLPRDGTPMADWIATRGTGEISPFTQEVMDAVVGIVRVPKS